MNSFGLAGASQIRVGGLFDTLSFFQRHDVFGEQAPLKSVRMVKIDILTLFDRDVTTVLVV